MTQPDQSASVWLMYDERGWTPEPAVVVRAVAPARRYGYRIEGPFVLKAENERLRKALRIIDEAHGPLRFDDEADAAFVRDLLRRAFDEDRDA